MGDSIGFTGTRRPVSRERIKDLRVQLSDFLSTGATEFHHGDCIGMDEAAHNIAKELGFKVILHPPENVKQRAYCRGDSSVGAKPYLVRNRDIVDSCDILIAVPANPKIEELRSGTWSTVRYALSSKTSVVVI